MRRGRVASWRGRRGVEGGASSPLPKRIGPQPGHAGATEKLEEPLFE
jgi:hypothetical protein